MDNYVKPIFIGIAASLLCILTALGIYLTLRPKTSHAQPATITQNVSTDHPSETYHPSPPSRSPGRQP